MKTDKQGNANVWYGYGGLVEVFGDLLEALTRPSEKPRPPKTNKPKEPKR